MPGNQIVAVQGYSRMPNMEIVARGTALVDSVDGNLNFPKPPLKLADVRTALEELKSLTAAARDGDKKIIAQRNRHREEVIKQIRLLVRYVEVVSDGDMAVFRSSSLEPAYLNRRPQQSWSESIRRIDRGNSGTLLIFINANPKASTYYLRYAVAGSEEKAESWTTIPI